MSRRSVVRQVAFTRPTTSNKVDVGSVVIAAGGWGKMELGVTPADGLAADPANKDTITVHDLQTLVKIGEDELEDSADNLIQLISEALTEKLAEQENDAFAAGLGDGSNQPWSVLHNVTQGVTAAVNATLTSDDVKRLKFTVPARFRENGVFLGHSSVEQAAALLKDTTGHYLWQESYRAGEPPTLCGHRWFTLDGLAAMTATGTPTDASLVFGDLRSGYWIADRRRLSVKRLSELYAAEGKIGLIVKLRVGGDVVRPTAIARLLL